MLTTQNSPPFDAPLRFFLTAPLFGIALGIAIMYFPDALFVSRWLPETLAIVHLCTLGVMAPIMLGALIQILPVVAGAILPNTRRIALKVHIFLSIGTSFLIVSFFNQNRIFMFCALFFLFLSFFIFLIAVFKSFYHNKAQSPTIFGLKLSLFSFLFTFILGFILISTQANYIYLPKTFTNLHAAWGLIGFSSILLISVSLVVVPMFQLTPNYPKIIENKLCVFLFIFLILFSASSLFNLNFLDDFFVFILLFLLFLFCIVSLKLQRKRRRARRDATFYAWEIALFFSSIACLILIINILFFDYFEKYNLTSHAFILIIYSFFGFIIGMLFKILPFLSWLHLQNITFGKQKIPPMNHYLTEKEAYFQLFFYALSFLSFILSMFIPLFRISNGILIALQFLILEIILCTSVLRYKKILKELKNKKT